MATPPVPDPYVALGVPKDATSAQIKATYRKAALKYHPDKVTDESLKASAADQFHRIQQAYEIIGDEDRRSRYDAQVRLMELRRDVMEKQSAKVDIRTAAYEVPTTSPGRTSYRARGPERVTEEVRPSKGYFDHDADYCGASRTASRKHADYDREYRSYSPREDVDRVKVSSKYAKENEKAGRKDSRRVSEKDRRRERESKKYTPHVEDDSDSDDYASTVRRDTRERDPYFDRDRSYASQDYDDSDRSRKYYTQEESARDHIQRMSGRRAEPEKRPSLARASSSRREVEHRGSSQKPVYVRRSSVRPSPKAEESSKKASPRSRERERQRSLPDNEVIEPARRPPNLQSHNSSPAAFKVPLQDSRRAQTMQARHDLPEHATPHIKRSDTMPVVGSSRRKDSVPHKSSTLRQTEVRDGYPTPSASPDYPDPYSTSSKYRNSDEDAYRASNSRRTESFDVPKTRRSTRSPEPADRQTRSSSSRYATQPPPPPPLRTNTSYTTVQSESPTTYSRPSPLGRHASERPLYGEFPTTKRYEYSDASREKSYKYPPEPESVLFSKPVGREDVRMASGAEPYKIRTVKPAFNRTVSSAY